MRKSDSNQKRRSELGKMRQIESRKLIQIRKGD